MPEGEIRHTTLDAFLREVEAEKQITETRIDQMEDAFLDFVSGEKGNEFIDRKFLKKALDERQKAIQKQQEAQRVKRKELPVEKLKYAADKFQKRNPELKSKMLMLLREQIRPGNKARDILRTLSQFYKDVSLADEALDFLKETTDKELAKEVQKAKDQLNEKYGREIAGGRNISTKAREFAAKGLGDPEALRKLYADITGHPRDSRALFDEFGERFAYKELKKAIAFLFHSLGADLKSKGPSIPRGLLHNLLNQTRVLQAILGVYGFFEGRMKLIGSQCEKHHIPIPKGLDFEQLAKQFMRLVGERYPSSEKFLAAAKRLGLEDWILAKIIVLSQMRDAVRQVALYHIYKSLQHRNDMLLAILEALEDLEDELEEEEEGEEGEEEAEE